MTKVIEMLQNNAAADHRANMEAFKSVLVYLADRYGCEWQHLGGKVYDRMSDTDKAIFSVCQARLESPSF